MIWSAGFETEFEAEYGYRIEAFSSELDHTPAVRYDYRDGTPVTGGVTRSRRLSEWRQSPIWGIFMRGGGLSSGLADLAVISNAESRNISPENPTGERGGGGKAQSGSAGEASRDLGVGWKVNPYIVIEPGETFTLADIHDSGVIQQIWMTLTGTWRFSILRIYWDDQESPSVESPVGDFFATDTMSGPTLPGAPTQTDGGAREKSSSSLMTMPSTRLSAAPEQRITSAGPTASSSRTQPARSSTRNSQHPTAVSIR